MRRLVVSLTAGLAALALVAGAAQAATGGPPPFAEVERRCAPLYPRQVMALRTLNASCAMARTLERLRAHNEPAQGFRVAGERWAWYVYSRAHGHTYEAFAGTAGVPAYVFITNRRPVS
jgi:hypothetical protein